MISIIVAIDSKGAIGRCNDIPWHLSDDLKRFKTITMGHTVIMGKNTWDSLPFKPLKGRRNIVVSTTMSATEGCEVVRSIEEACHLVKSDEQAFIMGGARIYEQTIGIADQLIVTHVDLTVDDADRFFPKIGKEWRAVEKSERLHDETSGLDYQYVTYIKE